MRKLINNIFRRYLHMRYKRIEHFMQFPKQAQEKWLQKHLRATRNTEWRKEHEYKHIRTPEQYAEQVPLQDYESLWPWIERMMRGERDILWPGRIEWFGKSAGTTNNKSKFIPVTPSNLKRCHVGGSWDAIAMFYHRRPDARQFMSRSLLMGGSLSPYPPHPDTMTGDISKSYLI